MTKTKVRYYRDLVRLSVAILFCWLYIPAVIAYYVSKNRVLINSDLERRAVKVNLKLSLPILLLFFLHTDRYYRSLFYYRIGHFASALISWIRPGDRYFLFSKTMKIGKEFGFLHPYSTVLNAESIGNHFTCLQCTTIGSKDSSKRPVIGDNVTLGAHVLIIGGVHIGDNVTVGAGCVVVKDIPSNCIVAGNPAKVIKYITG